MHRKEIKKKKRESYKFLNNLGKQLHSKSNFITGGNSRKDYFTEGIIIAPILKGVFWNFGFFKKNTEIL